MSKFDYTYSDPSAIENIVGSTPYGIYDSDETFVSESLSICKFVSSRLGHPVMQLEFNSGSIYAMFEEAVSEYSTQINHYNMKNWLWEEYATSNRISGEEAGSTGSFEPRSPGMMGTTFMLSKQYGTAVGVGGDVTMYSGSITLTGSQQQYNLQTEAQYEHSDSTKRLEIQRVFNDGPAAMTRFYDPFMNADDRHMLDDFGFGAVSPGISYVLRPISMDISRAQMIETSDRIRKSAYTFELVDNKIKIFPIPQSDDQGSKIYFQYYVRDDLTDTTKSDYENKVSNPSNVPYKFITYSEINSTGRQWIRKYTTALSKELLGIIRSKYASMPLPNGEVNLDGEGLKGEGREEKEQLLTELKEFLESVTLSEKSRMEQEQADAQQSVLNKAPLNIYIG